ncbi:MAG TPA: sigma 54-interacting transcriptional regulator, partial [bacterium]|nr:sigma 54-interacting transcriptional regulator [bacterium]
MEFADQPAADKDHDGFFLTANGGTLFLDEVADLPLVMQVKLLRVIQEKQVRRIGETQEKSVDVRIISATHKKLDQCVEAGQF